MSKLEVLISTMNRESIDFVKSMNIQTDTVVINQNGKDSGEEIHRWNDHKIKFISSQERGLSKSRNLAIHHSTADICLVADDDMIFDKDYEEKILETYKKYPEADIIAFKVKRTGNPERNKTFRKKKNWENYLTSMKISSVEITFRRDKIVQNNLFFNPYIGAGTEFYNGEENVFLYDALRKGLKVLYVPINIAEVDASESSWFEGYTDSYFKTVGAKFYNMSRKYYHFLIMQFALRKYKKYHSDISFRKAIQLMFKGARIYKAKYKE